MSNEGKTRADASAQRFDGEVLFVGIAQCLVQHHLQTLSLRRSTVSAADAIVSRGVDADPPPAVH